MIIVAATAVAGAAAGLGGVKLYRRGRAAQAQALVAQRRVERIERASQRQGNAIEEARVEADMLRETLLAELAATEAHLAEDAAHLDGLDMTTAERHQRLESRAGELDERFARFKARRAEVDALNAQIEAAEHEIEEALEASAGENREDVIERLREGLCQDAAVAANKTARLLEERVLDQREQEARRLIDLACQRYGTALPANRLINNVTLPRSTKQRERLLADDQAVLRAITEATEVEFNPQGEETLFLNGPDPFTREIGRLAYERMVRGGNISEAIAKKCAAKAHKDLHKTAQDAGNRAARMLKLRKVHPEILFLVGKLLYRTSYTQNQWQHAIETAHLCAMMAQELGLDVRAARRSALIHDIGKVLWAETEAVGSHAVSGAAFARERGEAPEIIHPVAAHHNDEKPSTPLAHLVAAADALSGARPGARRETLESYKQRVEDLERISGDYPVVRKAYVIQGGRELRVLVDPQRVDDLAAYDLSRTLAERIEDECIYPGQIQVTVVREIRRTAVSR